MGITTAQKYQTEYKSDENFLQIQTASQQKIAEHRKLQQRCKAAVRFFANRGSVYSQKKKKKVPFGKIFKQICFRGLT